MNAGRPSPRRCNVAWQEESSVEGSAAADRDQRMVENEDTDEDEEGRTPRAVRDEVSSMREELATLRKQLLASQQEARLSRGQEEEVLRAQQEQQKMRQEVERTVRAAA